MTINETEVRRLIEWHQDKARRAASSVKHAMSSEGRATYRDRQSAHERTAEILQHVLAERVA